MSNYTRVIFLDSTGALTDLFEINLVQYRTRHRQQVALRTWITRIAAAHRLPIATIKIQEGTF